MLVCVDQAWQAMPTKANSINPIISTCRTFWCLSACKETTSSLWYYTLKNLVIWLVESIFTHNLRTRILPDKELVVGNWPIWPTAVTHPKSFLYLPKKNNFSNKFFLANPNYKSAIVCWNLCIDFRWITTSYQ